MGTIKVSETVHDRLERYRDTHEHTSYDSAIRELLQKVADE